MAYNDSISPRIILDFNIDHALSEHKNSGALITLIKANSAENKRDSLNSFEVYEFTGAFLCEPEITTFFPAGRFDMPANDFLQMTSGLESINNYVTKGYYNPLTSFPKYEEAQQVFLHSGFLPEYKLQNSVSNLPKIGFPSFMSNQITPGVWVGLNTIIHPNARLAPPLCIGEGCRIGSDVELGPNTVIAPSVVIDDGATVQHSAIFRRSYIGRLVNIDGRIVNHSKMINLKTGHFVDITDDFLISAATPPKISYNKLFRFIDFMISLAIIVLLSPVFISTYILIRLFINKNPFSAQQYRNGIYANGEAKTVNILAFEIKTASGKMNKMGKLICFWGVQRLPELLNVLRGDMRLVGLKPLSALEYEYAEKNWQQQRHLCSIGFTGLWYIQGTQPESLDNILIADAYYIATRSFNSDLKILLKTFPTWYSRRIYEFKENRI